MVLEHATWQNCSRGILFSIRNNTAFYGAHSENSKKTREPERKYIITKGKHTKTPLCFKTLDKTLFVQIATICSESANKTKLKFKMFEILSLPISV
jgi:hypothetical protein